MTGLLEVATWSATSCSQLDRSSRTPVDTGSAAPQQSATQEDASRHPMLDSGCRYCRWWSWIRWLSFGSRCCQFQFDQRSCLVYFRRFLFPGKSRCCCRCFHFVHSWCFCLKFGRIADPGRWLSGLPGNGSGSRMSSSLKSLLWLRKLVVGMESSRCCCCRGLELGLLSRRYWVFELIFGQYSASPACCQVQLSSWKKHLRSYPDHHHPYKQKESWHWTY